ncbi:inositol polyphosphate kinase family protein [Spongorhabdus nitratireducens]
MSEKTGNNLSASATSFWQKAGDRLKSAYEAVEGAFSRWKVKLLHADKPASPHIPPKSTAVPGDRTLPQSTRITERQASTEPDRFATRFDGLGGHAENFIELVGHNMLVKRTSVAESRVYRDCKQLGLEHVIPTAKGRASKLMSDEVKKTLVDMQKNTTKGQAIVSMVKMGADIDPRYKREFDIKIGHSTASKAQLKRTGHKSPVRKKARMKMFDAITGSLDRGFRLVGGKVNNKRIPGGRALLGMQTRMLLKKALVLPQPAARQNLEKIAADLHQIRDAMQQAPVTFIDSSVLVVIDEKKPANTQVKMIDFGNPVYRDGPLDFGKAKQNYLSGLDQLIADVEKMLH